MTDELFKETILAECRSVKFNHLEMDDNKYESYSLISKFKYFKISEKQLNSLLDMLNDHSDDDYYLKRIKRNKEDKRFLASNIDRICCAIENLISLQKLDQFCTFEILNKILEFKIHYYHLIYGEDAETFEGSIIYESSSSDSSNIVIVAISDEDDEAMEEDVLFPKLILKGYQRGTITNDEIHIFEEILLKNFGIFSTVGIYEDDSNLCNELTYNDSIKRNYQNLKDSRMFIEGFQLYFPFSIEFIEKNCEKFFIKTLLDSGRYDNEEDLRVIFEKVLKSNLNTAFKFYSLGRKTFDMDLPEEKINEMLLKYIIL